VEVKRLLSTNIYEVKWEELSIEDIKPYIEKLDETPRKRILFTLKMNYSTRLALELIENPSRSKTERSRRIP